MELTVATEATTLSEPGAMNERQADTRHRDREHRGGTEYFKLGLRTQKNQMPKPFGSGSIQLSCREVPLEFGGEPFAAIKTVSERKL